MNTKNVLSPDILVVEDEEPISILVQYNLEKAGFDVRLAETGQEALFACQEKAPDLIILDWMLPEKSGIEVLGELRSEDDFASIPVIMLTARGEEHDKLLGLDSGADDYMIKPFSPKELIARVNAVLRRTRPMLSSAELYFEGLKADMNRCVVSFKEQPIHLGPTEFRLLTFFMEHPSKAYTREQLLDHVWGTDVYVEDRTVDVHIRRVRKALAKAEPHLENLIQTVRGKGYMLDKA